MNFATLNKKWFHEVNISVTIPSPTRGAHARTDVQRHDDNDDHDHLTTIRAGSDVRAYTFTRAYIRIIYNCIIILAHSRRFVRSFALSLTPSLLFFLHTLPHNSAYTRDHARTREEGPLTRVCISGRHTLVFKNGGERERDRKNGMEGRRKNKSSL